jgi:hypothetical protein
VIDVANLLARVDVDPDCCAHFKCP